MALQMDRAGSWNLTAIDAENNQLLARPARQVGGDPVIEPRGRSYICSILVNVLLSLLYAMYAYANVRFLLVTGSPVALGLLIFNTWAMMCLLTRKSPTVVTGSIRNWLTACAACVMPLLLRPVGSTSEIAVFISVIGQTAGLGIMIVSLFSLNRSFGIVAANRGVKTTGLYRWVRHPLYVGEITVIISFLFANWSYLNGLLIFALVLAQVVRAIQEEALLVRDERYVLYRAAVPYRFVPGLF